MRFVRFAARRADAMEAAAIVRYERRRELWTAVAGAIRVADAMARLEAALRSDQGGLTRARNWTSVPVPVPIPVDEPTRYGGGIPRLR